VRWSASDSARVRAVICSFHFAALIFFALDVDYPSQIKLAEQANVSVLFADSRESWNLPRLLRALGGLSGSDDSILHAGTLAGISAFLREGGGFFTVGNNNVIFSPRQIRGRMRIARPHAFIADAGGRPGFNSSVAAEHSNLGAFRPIYWRAGGADCTVTS